MKIIIVILLGLFCTSAFSACASFVTGTATTGGKTWKLGKDDGANGECCVNDGTTDSNLGTLACTPKQIFLIGTEVWLVMEPATAGLPLDATATAYTAITTVANKQASLAIGTLDTANPTKTLKGSYIGSVDTTATTWAAVTVGAGAKVCTTVTTLLSIPVTLAGANFLVDQTGVPNSDMTTATSTFIGYDTATRNFKGYSADPCLETFSSKFDVTYNSVKYEVGVKGNECCVQTGTTIYCYNDVNLPGTCTALDIAADTTSGDIWVALRISAAKADILTTANVNGASVAGTVVPVASLIADTVLIGKITTTTASNFGKFSYASYVAPKTSAAAWTTFTFTDLRACTVSSVKYVQVEGTLGANTWTDEAGVAIAAATGTGAFLVVNPATGDFQGFASTGRVCAGASILSIASAILAFVGLVAL